MIQKIIREMKEIYRANTIEQAEIALESFEKKGSKKHPAMVRSWKTNWEGLSIFYNYHPDIKSIMYTTNSIEGFNR
ncbi:transposase [Arenibacter palladensis]|uniref:transposase n=1 Tax=Arenibacter palladensis TaxID=237373 RepID=UPI0026E1331E|nr:transposase [Arenibacter palladensis]MDO6605153.1 transposase [Arenibacter palladensis]